MIGVTIICRVKRFTTRRVRLEAQRHREDRRENQCCGNLRFGVPNLKFPQPFLKEDKEREESFWLLSHLLFLREFLLGRRFAMFMAGVLTRRKNRKTFSSLPVSSLCLCASSLVLQAGGESSFEWLFTRHCTQRSS